ncbi:hypothetical protein OIE63_20900 [Streptomyces sp. NBC_01795]|uniref:hypothetical protein n=1 Tax=Streptomyces sp. NBC_01795 TaxID=2975943 RepID=UPI002DD8A2C6|nr:hypothetical protein [Streptomyces sp. NBC_01795]WSA93765.1 hypothetical protein OIE63_20900 [Streptomyces sp. NBC_01795]
MTGHRKATVAATLLTLIPLRGCSTMKNTGPGRVAKPSKVRKMLGYTPEVRKVSQAEDEVNRMSSRLVDAMGIPGAPSHIPAAAGPCSAIDPDFTTYYIVDHPWALWRADADDFDTAMENLRSRLPEMGWRITKDGPMNSMARNPEITAVHTASGHRVAIEALKTRSGDLKPQIDVTLVSPCYQAPEGTDLSRA